MEVAQHLKGGPLKGPEICKMVLICLKTLTFVVLKGFLRWVSLESYSTSSTVSDQELLYFPEQDFRKVFDYKKLKYELSVII